jgi:hypothetical protein
MADTFQVYLPGSAQPAATVRAGKLETSNAHLRTVWNARPKLVVGGTTERGVCYTEEREPATDAERTQAYVDQLRRLGLYVRES